MSKRRRPAAARRIAEQRFWGLTPPQEVPAPPPGEITPTSDPGALVRSLGTPPLALDGAVVERHFTAVYEEAVRAATALAAANGLLADGDDSEDRA